MFVPDRPKKVECLGPSAKGKLVTKWVDVKELELADLRLVWGANERVWGRNWNAC